MALSDEEGIRWDLFNTYEREDLRGRLGAVQGREGQQAGASTSGESPCLVYGPVITEATTFRSLDDSLARSAAIYTGTVLGYKEGFLYNHPGSLYEVAVHENLMPGATPARLFVYYPAAEFRLGDQRICKRGLRFPERPSVGGEILVFSLVPASASSEPVIHPSDSGLFFEAEGGGLSVPPTLRTLEGIRELPLKAIVDQTRKELGDTEPEVEDPGVPGLLDQLQGGRP